MLLALRRTALLVLSKSIEYAFLFQSTQESVTLLFSVARSMNSCCWQRWNQARGPRATPSFSWPPLLWLLIIYAKVSFWYSKRPWWWWWKKWLSCLVGSKERGTQAMKKIERDDTVHFLEQVVWREQSFRFVKHAFWVARHDVAVVVANVSQCISNNLTSLHYFVFFFSAIVLITFKNYCCKINQTQSI